MPLMRAMVIGQHDSGLPEDRFVNTFHFERPLVSTLAQAADQASEALTAFYTGAPATGSALTTYLANSCWKSVEYRFYDMDMATPRIPEIREQTWSGGLSASPYPEEVAVCLSIRGNLPGPRTRGRLYIGPLGLNSGAVSSGRVVVGPGIQATLVDRATDLMNSTMDVGWVIHSRVTGGWVDVTGGWVDNAYDTQRRRGLAPTGRATFGSATP